MISIKEFIISIIMGISLSVDAFSLSIIYGTLGLSKNKIMQLSLIVGIYHFLMPIIGCCFGTLISKIIIVPGNIIVAIIFFIIAIEMLMSIKDKKKLEELKNILSLLLFGLTVSLDSFFVGVGMGIIKDNVIPKSIIFATISATFTYIGIKIGNKINENFGQKTVLIGSLILIGIAIYYIGT